MGTKPCSSRQDCRAERAHAGPGGWHPPHTHSACRMGPLGGTVRREHRAPHSHFPVTPLPPAQHMTMTCWLTCCHMGNLAGHSVTHTLQAGNHWGPVRQHAPDRRVHQLTLEMLAQPSDGGCGCQPGRTPTFRSRDCSPRQGGFGLGCAPVQSDP